MFEMMYWFWPWMLLAWIWIPIALFAIVFWIWMLIDCLERKKFEDKLVWVLVLILLNALGAILYYFLVKSKVKRR